MAMLVCTADCQKSLCHDFGLGQVVLFHTTSVQGSGGGMELVPGGNLNAAVQKRVPSIFHSLVQSKLLKSVIKFPLSSG